MDRKKIKPKDAIKGTFEYLPEENSKFDKYAISIDGVPVAYLYMPKQAYLLPTNIYFKKELQVETIY